MGEYKKVATTDQIPAGEMKTFEVGYDKILICHTADGFYAIADECSHDSAPISQGELAGKEIICPRHGAKFDVSTGEVTGPPAVVPIDKYELKIEGENIYVMLED